MMARAGDWIQTYTGRAFWPLDPRPEDIDLADIAHALAHKCRFNGHCRRFYSVAQHCWHVSFLVPKTDALWGLMHDAAEAYLPDVPRPVKPLLTGFREIEARVMRVIVERFRLLPSVEPDTVKRADQAILADEARDVMSDPPAPWRLPEPPTGTEIIPWTADFAERAFLSRFHQLNGAVR